MELRGSATWKVKPRRVTASERGCERVSNSCLKTISLFFLSLFDFFLRQLIGFDDFPLAGSVELQSQKNIRFETRTYILTVLPMHHLTHGGIQNQSARIDP